MTRHSEFRIPDGLGSSLYEIQRNFIKRDIIMEFDDFEWDENKRNANIGKHGLDFLDVVRVLDNPYLEYPPKEINGEQRWIAIGALDDIVVAIVYTMRERVLRVISMRKARKNERKHYDTHIGQCAAQSGSRRKPD
ncbi:MAG: BrnT family toxin [Acidibrevibacterium sp.]|uniref:BrnT family toxin n=1 Tax=Acidibrevibacterium sp. TaxID=2606776 RepID=UPI003D07969C